MIVNPMVPGYYGQSNQLLIRLFMRDMNALQEKWLDEASEQALAGNPQRAGYIEFMAAKL